MLPRRLRLTQPQDFQSVRQRGRRWRGTLLSVGAMPNSLPYSRYGFVVGKRVSQAATTRNRVKRRLREVTRHQLPNLKHGLDVVVTAHPAAVEAAFQELEAVLAEAFRQLQVVRAVEEKS